MGRVEDKIASAIRWSISGTNYRRARSRALTRLSNNHKEEYLGLLEEEKARDEAQGKTWTNIVGDNSVSVGTNSHAQPNGSTTEEDEGDNL